MWEEEDFLRRILPDNETRQFIQRAVGYSLFGHTNEEVLFILHGDGGTGKTSFLEAVRAVLGDYAVTAEPESFLRRHADVAVRNDIARLAGARFVASAEVEKGQHLAESLIKRLTGGDKVTARFLYRE